MVRISWLMVFSLIILEASQNFQDACIKCHKAEGIPNVALYKRYLLKYSSKAKVKDAMLKYIKNPTVESTIMPPRFINKFGLKEAMILSDAELNMYVDELIERYDVKHKLYIPQIVK